MFFRVAVVIAVGWLAVIALALPSQISAYERAQGWRLLFDGETWSGWHGFGARRVAANWEIVEGACVAREEGRAIVSDEEFEDFELTFRWRVARGGRAEVYFRMSEDEELPARTGPVFHLAGPKVVIGGNGVFEKTEVSVTERPDEWQTARLVVAGNRVEHWIAGQRVLAYTLKSAEWRAALADSRYAAYPNYARWRDGAIAFSGRGAEFRDIKIRRL